MSSKALGVWLGNSRASARFLLHGGGSPLALRDLRSLRTSKFIHQPTGGWSATLNPVESEDYQSKIKPDDWVELDMTPGERSNSSTRVMCGLVDDVAEVRRAGPDGAPETVVQVSGRDWPKIIVSTSMIFDQYLGALQQAGILNIEAIRWAAETSATKTPGVIVKNLLQKFLGTQRQFVHPHTGATPGNLIDYTRVDENTEGRAPAHNFNVQGTLYYLINAYANTGLNELWFDSGSGDLPFKAVLREYPFSRDAFTNLTTHTVLGSETVGHRVSRNEQYAFNWFRVHTDFSPAGENPTTVLRLGKYNPASILRHGLRRMEIQTEYAYTGELSDPIVIDSIERWTRKIAEWHSGDVDLWWGSITTRLRPDIRIGNRLVYALALEHCVYEFYVFGVEHSYNFPGASTTTIHVGRGRRRRVDAPISTYEELERSGVVSNIGDVAPEVLL